MCPGNLNHEFWNIVNCIINASFFYGMFCVCIPVWHVQHRCVGPGAVSTLWGRDGASVHPGETSRRKSSNSLNCNQRKIFLMTKQVSCFLISLIKFWFPLKDQAILFLPFWRPVWILVPYLYADKGTMSRGKRVAVALHVLGHCLMA